MLGELDATPEQIAADLTLPEWVFILTRGQTDPAGRGYAALAKRGLADSWGFTSQGQKVARIVVGHAAR
jgi:hypothetical protein